jgi:hypothetical protein
MQVLHWCSSLCSIPDPDFRFLMCGMKSFPGLLVYVRDITAHVIAKLSCPAMYDAAFMPVRRLIFMCLASV